MTFKKEEIDQLKSDYKLKKNNNFMKCKEKSPCYILVRIALEKGMPSRKSQVKPHQTINIEDDNLSK